MFRPASLRTRLAVTALAATVLLSACAGSGNDASPGERQELANMPEFIMVPGTRPASLVRSFRSYCVETPSDNAVRTATLRAADYIPMGGFSGGVRRFVVADLRPMVILSDTGRMCAVRARARSGQSNAIQRLIAEEFPGAAPLAASPDYDAAWETAPGQAEVIALIRNQRGPDQNEITIALMRR